MRALCSFKRHAVRGDKAAESPRECMIINISCAVLYFKDLRKTALKSHHAAVFFFFLLVNWRPTWALTLSQVYSSPGEVIMPVSSVTRSAAAPFIPSNLRSEQWETQ